MRPPPRSPIRLIHDEETGDGPLRRWRENVGAPVALDLARADAAPPREGSTALVVVSWNVWIGRGRLAELLARIRAEGLPAYGVPPGAPLVALVQEAARADDTVPRRSNGFAGRELFRRFRLGEDVADVARALALNLRYAPSMRNGPDASDRGNAVLTTLPIEETFAFELPYVFQRRVAVVAALRYRGERLRVCAAHLDPRGLTGRDWLGVAGRGRQAERLVETLLAAGRAPLVLGADLNLSRGRREEAWRRLHEAGFTHGVPDRPPAWRHTYHRAPRLVLDYLLVRDPAGRVARAEVHRLDERPRDQGPYVFRSDHHPLVACLELHGGHRPDQ